MVNDSVESTLCAGQRSDEEGSSFFGSGMRGAVSVSGGNASLAVGRGGSTGEKEAKVTSGEVIAWKRGADEQAKEPKAGGSEHLPDRGRQVSALRWDHRSSMPAVGSLCIASAIDRLTTTHPVSRMLACWRSVWAVRFAHVPWELKSPRLLRTLKRYEHKEQLR